jgi:hypothetical protein
MTEQAWVVGGEMIEPMEYGDFRANVIRWATDRNLISGSTLAAQFLKLVEEVGEIAGAKARGNRDGMIDGVGDSMVVAVIMAMICGDEEVDPIRYFDECYFRNVMYAISDVNDVLGMDRKSVLFRLREMIGALEAFARNEDIDPAVCRSVAWIAIKDRKGKMVDGVFVKET